MSDIFWTAARQLQAVREAVYYGITNATCSSTGDEQDRRAFLETHGFTSEEIPRDAYLNQTVDRCREALATRYGVDLDKMEKDGQRTRFPSRDFGSERSSAGWNDWVNFITTSALIRLLGALEQYERDVLRALVFARPAGILGDPQDNETQDVLLDDLSEDTGTEKDGEAGASLWTYLSKPSENNEERAKIFSRMFGIKLKELISLSKKETEYINKSLKDLYALRNKLAHGRERVEFSLRDYAEAEILVYVRMCHLREECRKKQKVEVN